MKLHHPFFFTIPLSAPDGAESGQDPATSAAISFFSTAWFSSSMMAFPIMEAILPAIISLLLLPSLAAALSDDEIALIADRQLKSFNDPRGATLPESINYDLNVIVTIPNPQLQNAYTAFQAVKSAIYSDPKNFTGNWFGPYVCSYNGIYCAPSPSNSSLDTIASVDLNGAGIAGFLPAEIGLLPDAAVFHANSNHLCGIIPESFGKLNRMFELDLSNNHLAGTFPEVILKMPALKYLDLRFNRLEGRIPPELFEKDLDALFLNDNRFDSHLPENIGKSTVSVAVLANNRLTGCVPRSIGKMVNLNELILMNNELDGCLPVELGLLGNLTVFDVGFNSFSGVLPESIGGLENLEELDVSHNMITGVVPREVCRLPALTNFTLSSNYFNAAPPECLAMESADKVFDDFRNCISGRKQQREDKVCAPVAGRPVDCRKFKCGCSSPPAVSSPPPPLQSAPQPVYSPPPPVYAAPPPSYSQLFSSGNFAPPPAESVLPPAGG